MRKMVGERKRLIQVKTKKYLVAPGVTADLCVQCVLTIVEGVRKGTHLSHAGYLDCVPYAHEKISVN